jgi:hypothetical protein
MSDLKPDPELKQRVSRVVLKTLALSRGHLLFEDVLVLSVRMSVRPRPDDELIKEVLTELSEQGLAKSLPGDLPGDPRRWLLDERGEAWAAKNDL